MSKRKLEGVKWYIDGAAHAKGEPGIYNSFVGSLATSLKAMRKEVDPNWLMATSAFAFRIYINEVMCPSAMSVFDWSTILPEAVEQAGSCCTYVSRYWHEQNKEKERRLEAQQNIIEAITQGIPCIVWDVQIPEWGVIFGYDDRVRIFDSLACTDEITSMPFAELGQREIKILSVAILGKPNGRAREEVILRSLKAAVRHAEQKEWLERPKYQDGLPAFDLWARILEPGTNENTHFEEAGYYAGHYYGARCYARDYLKSIADGAQDLEEAAASYERVASFLKPLWDHFPRPQNTQRPSDAILRSLADSIRKAKAAEEEGIEQLKRYITKHS